MSKDYFRKKLKHLTCGMIRIRETICKHFLEKNMKFENVLNKTNIRPSFYYGWVVIAVGFITLGFSFGVWYSFSVFFTAVIQEFGWSRAAGSSIFSVFIICQALMGIATGYFQDRFGPRIVVPMGAVVLAFALFLTSRADQLWHFSLGYGVLAGIGISLLGFTSHASFLPLWFERKRGLAVGIAMSGIGFGMLVFVPLAEKVITLYGWRSAYLLLGATVLFFVAPLNLVLSRHKPQDLGLKPDGDGSGKDASSPKFSRIMKIIDTQWVENTWTIKKAATTSRFWFLAVGFFSISFAYQGILLHSISALVDAGMRRDSAAVCFGIMGSVGSVGKILMGYLSDVIGRERVNTLGAALAIMGIVCLMTAHLKMELLPFLFAFTFGIGYGAAAPLLPSVIADVFLGATFGRIFATIALMGGAGGASGSFVSGLLYDVTGSYILPFSLNCLSLAFACTFIWLAGPSKVRRMVKVRNVGHVTPCVSRG